MKVQLDSKVIRRAITVAVKVIRFARGGFDRDERTELAGDLLELAGMLAEDIASDLCR